MCTLRTCCFGSISAEYDTYCTFCRLLTQKGRFWGPISRLLGQLFAINWAKGDLYSRFLGQTELNLPVPDASEPNVNLTIHNHTTGFRSVWLCAEP
jgi:hypothetical protein